MSADAVANVVALLLTGLATAALVVLGWRVAHRHEMERDRAAKRTELRVQYLIEAYRRLEYVSNRPVAPETAPDFEKAIADIQLFGTPTQVQYAQDFAQGFARAGTASLDPLLADLRQDLRKELGLGPVPTRIKFLRMRFDDRDSAP